MSTSKPIITYTRSCSHNGLSPVVIGGKPVWLGAMRDIDDDAFLDKDFIISLNGSLPNDKIAPGTILQMIHLPLQDYGGVPDNWVDLIDGIAHTIQEGAKVLAYCLGSHGRTGCFAASLIARMEPRVKDPIAEIRKRHCSHCVESRAQAEAVFSVRGQKLPEQYRKEFSRKHSFVFQGGQQYLPGVGYSSTPSSGRSGNHSDEDIDFMRRVMKYDAQR